MLILTRRINETIILNPGQPNQITITLVDWYRGRGRIGIDAPQEVVIVRSELLNGEKKAKSKK